jgi:8-oxo-dGTP pyrophosphatase MutT (NUDIX family)
MDSAVPSSYPGAADTAPLAVVEPRPGQGADALLAAPGASARKLSCGVVIVNRQAELLLCHVTGQDHWDLPKGGAQPGESPLAAALRETAEETGLLLDPAALVDLGRLPYRARKDLHLFATLAPRLDVTQLHCDSHYTHALSRQRLPEMDDYGWFGFDSIRQQCTGKLAAVLCERLNLPALLLRLASRAESPRLAA